MRAEKLSLLTSNHRADAHQPDATTSRGLRRLALIVFAILMGKVLLAILAKYPGYFPPDFETTFLIGRQKSFFGIYAVAFYAHIIAGPVVFLAASFLMFSGHRSAGGRLHRITGRIQVTLILAVIVPSGLIMASRAMAGPVAGVGLAVLALGTGATALMAVRHAMQRKFDSHRIWATRCYVLLVSPLILRVITGGAVVMGLDTTLFYQLNAWLSWALPLIGFELFRGTYAWLKFPAPRQSTLPTQEPS